MLFWLQFQPWEYFIATLSVIALETIFRNMNIGNEKLCGKHYGGFHLDAVGSSMIYHLLTAAIIKH